MDLNFKEGEEWYLEQCFEELKQFRSTGSYTSLKKNNSDGIVGVNILQNRSIKPSNSQILALEYFQNNQKEILESICVSISNYIPEVKEIYGSEYVSEILENNKINNALDLKKIIGIGYLHIFSEEKDNLSYIGFECGCPWDEEHGLGIIIHNNRIIDIGSADISFCGSKKLRQDNGTYSDKERERDERWEKERLENVKKYQQKINQQKILDNKDIRIDKKKWWEFWK